MCCDVVGLPWERVEDSCGIGEGEEGKEVGSQGANFFVMDDDGVVDSRKSGKMDVKIAKVVCQPPAVALDRANAIRD